LERHRPQWAPDWSRVAFVSDRTGQEYEGSHNKDIWVIGAYGGPLTEISDHAFEDEMPRLVAGWQFDSVCWPDGTAPVPEVVYCRRRGWRLVTSGCRGLRFHSRRDALGPGPDEVPEASIAIPTPQVVLLPPK
jgi:hypothetical protein